MDSRDTDERLRTRLNANQLDRERLCLAVLSLDKRFSRVRPRRPSGGPDGSRDIEALLDNTVTVWGAVGFQNQVSDSLVNIRETKKKFKSDLDAALEENEDLRAFVFFTNVDLSPAEQIELKEHAAKRGITFVEIFWREVIRGALDRPDVLALRFQYLGMPMSEAEQASFFARWGTDFEQLLFKQHQEVGARLDRVEFRVDCLQPLSQLMISIQLDQEYAPESVGFFRFMLEFSGLNNSKDPRNICIAARDDLRPIKDNGQKKSIMGVKSLAGSDVANAIDANRNREVFVGKDVNHLYVEMDLTSAKLVKSLDDLEDRLVLIYMNERLRQIATSLRITANGYILFNVPVADFYWIKQNPKMKWPFPIAQSQDQWLCIGKRAKNEKGEHDFNRWFQIDFQRMVLIKQSGKWADAPRVQLPDVR